MTISLVVHTVAHVAGSTTCTTTGIDTTGANFVACVAVSQTGTAPAVTDNKSNGTATALTRNDGSQGRDGINIAYYLAPTVGSGHTFTMTSGSNLFGTLLVAAFSGVKTSAAFDQQLATAAAGAGATTINTGSITPTENNELIIAGWGIDDPTNTSWTVDSGFTITDTQDVITGATYGGVLAYLVQTAAAAVNPKFTRSNAISSARQDTAVIASFKAPAAQISPRPLVIGQAIKRAAGF